MADQASMRGNGPGTAGGRFGVAQATADDRGGNGESRGDVVGGVAGLGEDLLSLAELQARLAAIELRQNVQAAKLGGAVIAVGSVLALSAIPIGLAGVAELLVSLAGMNRGLALIIVSVAALAIAGAAVALGLGRLRASDMGFPLTKEEFARNLNWIRTVLIYSGRSARRGR